MIVYTPFHYLQNRTIQELPIAWQKPHYWFRGLPALALGKAPTLALQVASYEGVTHTMQKYNPELSSTQKTAAALCAGGASGIINNFTHLVALHQENNGTSCISTIKHLHMHKALARGLGSTMTREMLFAYTYLHILKDMKQQMYEITNNLSLAQSASGLLSGAIVATTTQPFMVITAKLYADTPRNNYKHGVDAALKIITQQGIRGFYKGTGYRSLGVICALPVFDDYVETTLKNLHQNHMQ